MFSQQQLIIEDFVKDQLFREKKALAAEGQ
jgi:hypothetical protein